MTGHLFESTLVLAVAILLAQLPRLAARTRYAIVFAALMKFAVPSAIVPRVLAFLGIELAHVPRGTIVIEALGPLSAADRSEPAVSLWPAMLITLWLVVAIGLLARALLRGRIALRRALAEASDATPGELAALGRAISRARLERPVRLVRSESISAPATAGMLRPVILIPAATHLAADELETILTHECAHVARRDNLLGLVESIAGCALWFHPLVWIARRILDGTREEACDAVVIASSDSGTYINALRKVCEAAIGPRVAAVSCIVSNTIHERMEAIMRFGSRRLLNHRAVIAVVLALLTATTLGIGVARALPSGGSPDSKYKVDVTLTRDVSSDVFNFAVTVSDRASGVVVSTANLRSRVEQWSTATSEMTSKKSGHHTAVVRAIGHADGTAEVETTVDQEPAIVARIAAKSEAARSSNAVGVSGDSPLRVGGDVKPPVIINRVEPIYPALAKASRISGVVILEVVIDHTGVVKDARIVKPLPFGLDQAALDAVKQWTFRPATLNGTAVDVLFNLTINFRAAEPAAPRTIAQGPTPSGGEPISIDLKDADIRDVMKTFSLATNMTILVDDDIRGPVTVSVRDTPWMDAFDHILRDANLRYER
ncbi:MAG TPA: TonB family protein, partial [Thermoanaerobaculia bacterium]|nr:TonB family protein [Thermoanaerobaculia bacterium]